MNKTEKFIEKAVEIHKGKYDYSKVIYKSSNEKVCIICPEHNEFWQRPKDHLTGRGCPICGKLTSSKSRLMSNETFISKANEIHKGIYDYSKTEYNGYNNKVCIICKKHGQFMMTPSHHLNGEGCRECGIVRRSNKNTKDREYFIKKAINIHNDNYDYSDLIYNGSDNLVNIKCKTHGTFYQIAFNHTRGEGCPECGRLKSNTNNRSNIEEFIEKANIVHNNKYDYSNAIYTGSENKLIITCPIHGDFNQEPGNHIQGQGCKKCFMDKSNIEREVFEYIKKIYNGEVIENNRKILEGKEIDIFIPDLKIGFEVNGLLWHSEIFNPENNYHINKTILSESKGVRLIHIFEDEWRNKKEIVKSLISSILSLNKVIYARKCEIREVENKESKEFLNKNHLQGNVTGTVKIGLYYNNELSCIMTFSKNRVALGCKAKEGEYEMIRFCNRLNLNVIGGASRLLKYFIKKYRPNKIKSYADRRWSKGNMYDKLGFKFIRCSKPNYYYVVNKKRENRFNYRKDILVKQGFDKNKSEHEIMIERKIPRIYDCGCLVYEINLIEE